MTNSARANRLTLRATLSTALRLRKYFMPYLLPALLLLLAALGTAAVVGTASGLAGIVTNRITANRPHVVPNQYAPNRPHVVPTQNSPGRSWKTAAQALPDRLSTKQLILLMVVISMLGLALEIIINRGRATIAQQSTLAVQGDLVAALSRELHTTRGRRDAGSTMQLFNVDAAQLSGLLVFGLLRVGESLVRVGALAAIIVFNVKSDGGRLVLIMIIGAIVYQIVLFKLFTRPTVRLAEQSTTLSHQFAGRSIEFFREIGKLMYFGGEQRMSEQLIDEAELAGRVNLRMQFVGSSQDALQGLLGLLAVPLILAMLKPGDVSEGDIVQTQILVVALLGSLAALFDFPQQLIGSGPSLRRIENILDVPAVGPQPAEVSQLHGNRTAPAVRVENVSFTYPEQPRELIKNLSLHIPRGATVGLVANNGAGKSTLARLLVGDLTPTAGRIYIDDVDVTEWHLHWRREFIAFMPAEPGFISGSIRDNVLFGRAPEQVPEFDRAIEMAGASDVAQKFGSLDTPLGANPEAILSTGERKKTALARLMAGSQRVWIVDEPGAGLSPSGMGEIAEALHRAGRDRTSVIITHDPDVFITDFNIYFDGNDVHTGTHEELLARTDLDYKVLVSRFKHEREVLENARSAVEEMQKTVPTANLAELMQSPGAPSGFGPPGSDFGP